jgi:hypothetical protein
MKKLLVGLSLLALSAGASASDFFGGGDGEWKMGPYGPYYEESDWPEWTPMYWMDEFMNEWDSDDENYGGFGGMPFMGGGNPGMMPYGAGPMMAPMGAPMMAPMGVPQMGMAGPMMAPQMMPPQMGMAGPMMAPMPMPMPAAPGATPGPAIQAAPAVTAPAN